LAGSQLAQAAPIRDGVHGLVLMGTRGRRKFPERAREAQRARQGSCQAITPPRRRCRPGTSRL